jgi:hypothetical protein
VNNAAFSIHGKNVSVLTKDGGQNRSYWGVNVCMHRLTGQHKLLFLALFTASLLESTGNSTTAVLCSKSEKHMSKLVHGYL